MARNIKRYRRERERQALQAVRFPRRVICSKRTACGQEQAEERFLDTPFLLLAEIITFSVLGLVQQ